MQNKTFYEVISPDKMYDTRDRDVVYNQYRVSISPNTLFHIEEKYDEDFITKAPYYRIIVQNCTIYKKGDIEEKYYEMLLLFLTLMKKGYLSIPEDAWKAESKDVMGLYIDKTYRSSRFLTFNKSLYDSFTKVDPSFEFTNDSLGKIPRSSLVVWGRYSTGWGNALIELKNHRKYNDDESTRFIIELISTYLTIPNSNSNYRTLIMDP
jgi:hypothetical protein